MITSPFEADPSVIHTITLEHIRLQIQDRIAKFKLKGVEVYTEIDYLTNDLLITLEKEILRHKLKDVSVRWPETWWDAFKHRWFPKWLLDRFPVVWASVDYTIWRNYPDLELPSQRSFIWINKTCGEVGG